MIEKGILALMVIFTINAVMIASGVAGNFNDPQQTISILPAGLTPSDINSSATDIVLVDAGVDTGPTTFIDYATTLVIDFILSLPLIGPALNTFITLGGVFFKFMFYWTIVLDIMGLPPAIIFIIKVPLFAFQLGVLFFVLYTIVGAFTGIFR